MTPSQDARAVLTFWFEEIKPKQRFVSDPDVDKTIRERFGDLHGEAASGTLDDWAETPDGALALIILLDQFSRNLARGSGAAFAHDDKALGIARAAITAGHDLAFEGDERAFFYMPFMHAENLGAQEEGVTLFTERLPDTDYIDYAIQHRDIIRQFGRFPHRNEVLGREMRPEEQKYLDEGGATFS